VKLLVTGATGCVGRAVVDVALRRGWQVVGLARSAPDAPLPSDVQLVRGDVRDRASVEDASAGCDVVIHTAGWVHRVPRSDSEIAELRSSIVNGTEVVAHAAQRGGARLVVTSTVAAIGALHTPYGRAKLEAEEAAKRACSRTAIVRPAVVYGPHDRGNVVRLIAAIAQRRAAIVGDGSNRKSMVASANLADRLVLAAEHRTLAGEWVAADEPAPTQRELQAAIAAELGRRTPPRIPMAPLRWAARGLDLLGRVSGGQGGVWSDRVEKLASDTVFPGAPLDEALGYTPRVPFERAIAEAVRWWWESGREAAQP
jgi:nucleoside-diphosphate-sugar epimerase